MTNRMRRPAALLCAALALTLVAAACSSTTSTPQPTPNPTAAVVTPSPEPTTATLVPTFTPWPTGTPTPVPTPPPSITPKPASTPISGPTSPAGVCVGTASNVAFLTDAAKNLKFTVYCATKLARGWGFSSSPASSWSGGSSGRVLIYYQYRSTATRLDVCEGSFGTSNCSGATTAAGTASFGGMSGKLYTTSDGFALLVSPGTTHAYSLVGHNVAKATFVAIAANMMAVPKS